MEVVLLLLAGSFCLVTGANDGASVVAMAARIAPRLLLPAIGVLSLAVAVAPLVSSGVAVTLARRLAAFDGHAGVAAVAVVAAATVVAVLSVRGEPTSLTLAVIGALGGAGLGWGGPVDWTLLGSVLVIAALAPAVALLLASGVTVLLARVRPRRPLRRAVTGWHHAAFGLQAVAYAANDGQKMLAVVALLVPSLAPVERPTLPPMMAVAGLFLVGTLLGLRKVAGTLGGAVLPVRPVAALTAEFSAGAAVAASAAMAAPVSMTQSVTGGLLGSNVRSGYRGIRWRVAGRLGRAWLITLPFAFGLAAAATTLLRILEGR
jgi:inorganic phosphate transporter, PiT family